MTWHYDSREPQPPAQTECPAKGTLYAHGFDDAESSKFCEVLRAKGWSVRVDDSGAIHGSCPAVIRVPQPVCDACGYVGYIHECAPLFTRPSTTWWQRVAQRAKAWWRG